ncbi:hypothetical protein AC41_4837 [Escherichia coli 2-011-08_S3_C3]|nr:hypothetical protein AC41_4837 [Escherichia coli 2-011-08_S3_C3]KDT08847.1 hypothetical protein AB83_5084 [Escherichia coli 2-011-08_S3_C1]
MIVVIFLLLYFSMRQISIASLRSLFSFQKAVTSVTGSFKPSGLFPPALQK